MSSLLQGYGGRTDYMHDIRRHYSSISNCRDGLTVPREDEQHQAELKVRVAVVLDRHLIPRLLPMGKPSTVLLSHHNTALMGLSQTWQWNGFYSRPLTPTTAPIRHFLHFRLCSHLNNAEDKAQGRKPERYVCRVFQQYE